jgi:uncharacterized membrane protein YhhN
MQFYQISFLVTHLCYYAVMSFSALHSLFRFVAIICTAKVVYFIILCTCQWSIALAGAMPFVYSYSQGFSNV